ncbi:MAG: hypothetical protein O7H39_03185 [Gammaproteobacteria bacterium]|nr:hypothetical protein [Gammaproteobacteria bacterium]
MMRPAMLPLHAAGVPLAAWVFDTTGRYTPAFAGFLVLYVLSAMTILGLRVTRDAAARPPGPADGRLPGAPAAASHGA